VTQDKDNPKDEAEDQANDQTQVKGGDQTQSKGGEHAAAKPEEQAQGRGTDTGTDKGKDQAQRKDKDKGKGRDKGKGKGKGKSKEQAEDEAASEPDEPVPEPRLLEVYRNTVVSRLKEQFQYKNPLEIPTLRKIVVNMGVGKAIENKSRLEHAVRELGTITGQKPITNRARKSIATFKLREGYPIGCSVTLRGARMWEFLDRLVAIAVPRIRDFRGLRRKLDGRGNYTMGLSEQSVFPEVDLDRVEFVQGMDITFVTTAKTDEEGFALLQGLGMPFRK